MVLWMGNCLASLYDLRFAEGDGYVSLIVPCLLNGFEWHADSYRNGITAFIACWFKLPAADGLFHAYTQVVPVEGTAALADVASCSLFGDGEQDVSLLADLRFLDFGLR